MRLAIVACAIGIACFGGPKAYAAPTDYIVNGGFETGNFTGWTVANANNTFVQGTNDPSYLPNTGSYSALLGTVGNLGSLSQTFTDNAGEVLTIGYFLASDGGLPNEFRVDFNGATLFDANGISATPYTPYSFDVVATGSDTLTFYARNDPGFLTLDDISVVSTAVMEPVSAAVLAAGLVGVAGTRRRRPC